MKYLVFSDLHGSVAGLELLIAAVKREKPDCLLCLGDTLFGAYDGDSNRCSDYLSHSSTPILGVRGNCDHYYDERVLGFSLPEEQTLYFAGHRMLLRHAPFYSDFKPGDIVMYGHTHVKTLSKSGGVITLNPGSIGKPRDGAPGYAIIDEAGVRLLDARNSSLIESVTF
ncbi:MAG: YfcE family phosphodiesterase [Bacilli bacterium]|nr:YfcE family phosphodiesterase [Bacilli bacterium]